MADDFDSMIRAIRTTFKDENFQNRFAFEDEIKNSLQMLVEKHRVDTGSIQEALCSRIPAREILLEEIQHWISVIKKRLSPRMKAHNAWTIEFKRDIPSRVPFNFKSCTESSKCIWRVLYRNKKKHFHSLYREETSNQKLDRLGANNSRNIVRILQPKFSRKEERERKCYLQQGEAFFHPV